MLSFINIVPGKYILFISIFLILLHVLAVVFINAHRKIGLKVLGTFFMSLLIVCSILGIYYLHNTNVFIKENFVEKDAYHKNTYYVLSLSNQNLSTNDINGVLVSYGETVHLNEAYAKLRKKYSVGVQNVFDIRDVFDYLNTGVSQLALIEKSSYEIAFSVDKSLNRDNYKVVYEFDVYTEKKTITNPDTNPRKFNVYIGGKDFTNLMDFNVIASINMDTHEVLFTSIPKDYYIEVVGKNGRFDKVGFMSAYGEDTCRESLEKFLGITIDYTLIVDTDNIVDIVDYIGGIEFCSDYTYTTAYAKTMDTYEKDGKEELTIMKGCQQLDGIETLTVAKERFAFADQDLARQDNCRKIAVAILKKLAGTDTVFHYNETLHHLGNLYETDLPKDIITSVMKEVVNDENDWKVRMQSVSGTENYAQVHLSSMIDWVMYPDQESVTQAVAAIEETLK